MKKYILDVLKMKHGFWAWLFMWMPIWAIGFYVGYFIQRILR